MTRIDQVVRNKSYIFRKSIRRVAARRGYTLKSLGAEMKMPSKILRRWLNGKHDLNLRNISKLEVALKVDLIKFPEFEYSNPIV